MKKIEFTILTLICVLFLPVGLAYANSYESNTQTPNDDWGGGNYPVGQSFTASSDHTITSVSLYFTSNISASYIMHISNTSAGLPTTDLVTSSATAVSANSLNTFTIPCVSLTSGVQYAFWVDPQAGSTNVGGTNPGTYSGGTLLYLTPNGHTAPNNTSSEDTSFTIYGDDGACSSPPPPAGTFVASSTNTYIFLLTSYSIFLFQLFVILMIFFIVSALLAWPIKKLIEAFRKIIKRGGR